MKKQTMGEMIAALRKEKGMTQSDLANKMGVTDKAVSKWERDLSCPDVSTLPRLAEVFEISVDELMQGKTEGTAEKKEDIQELIATILKAIPVAMGVAVAALSVMGKLDVKSGLSMLGIGLACAGLSLLQKK